MRAENVYKISLFIVPPEIKLLPNLNLCSWGLLVPFRRPPASNHSCGSELSTAAGIISSASPHQGADGSQMEWFKHHFLFIIAEYSSVWLLCSFCNGNICYMFHVFPQILWDGFSARFQPGRHVQRPALPCQGDSTWGTMTLPLTASGSTHRSGEVIVAPIAAFITLGRTRVRCSHP